MNQEITVLRKTTYWWIPLILGIIFIAAGVWILVAPNESFEKITKFIGVIILVSGTSGLFLNMINRRTIPGWGYQLAGGLIDMAIGLILIFSPEVLLKIITIFVAIWLLISSFMVIRLAIEFKEGDRDIWKWELILGLFLFVLAIILLWHPMILGLTIAIWTAAAFIILGVFRISLTIRLKRLNTKARQGTL